ncbi:hypothetical protein EPR50_G00128500 [Perca flavescens]|uniref:G-protein coupled receptors family 1 profile domain-containing protein n=1 Tax=Perca flavescens TaxID=8167 RepID=A0A484CR08_PERFV|nr:hypothetical protein EPR50_G00128500 [Perca flavescens]
MLWVVSMLCAVPNTSLHGIWVLPPKFGRQFPRSALCHVIKPIWMYKLVILISTLAFFLLPMLIISILYLLIGLRLHRERKKIVVDIECSFGPASLSRSHVQKRSKRNLQVTKMLCVLVVVFGLCWAPFHVDRMMWSYMSEEEHHHIFKHVHIVSGVFFYLSSAVNPILYNLMSSKFREMFSHVTCYYNSWSVHSSLQLTQRSTLSEKMPNSI